MKLTRRPKLMTMYLRCDTDQSETTGTVLLLICSNDLSLTLYLPGGVITAQDTAQLVTVKPRTAHYLLDRCTLRERNTAPCPTTQPEIVHVYLHPSVREDTVSYILISAQSTCVTLSLSNLYSCQTAAPSSLPHL